MPIKRTTGAGEVATASADATLRQNSVLALDAQAFTDALLVDGLPHCAFWAQQSVGALGAIVIPQFSIRQITGNATPTNEWLDFSAPIVLVPGAPGTPMFLTFRFPAKLIRLAVTRPAGQATTVRVALGGCL